jgi:hypothetical protein
MLDVPSSITASARASHLYSQQCEDRLITSVGRTTAAWQIRLQWPHTTTR